VAALVLSGLEDGRELWVDSVQSYGAEDALRQLGVIHAFDDERLLDRSSVLSRRRAATQTLSTAASPAALGLRGRARASTWRCARRRGCGARC